MKTRLERPKRSRTQPGIARNNRVARRVRPKQLLIKKILVPVDFSRPSIEAVKYATSIAAEFGAELHLVYVHSDDEPGVVSPPMGLLMTCDEAIRSAQKHLRELPAKHEIRFRVDHCHVVCGRPFEEICKLAETIAADLIVLPTRGNSGLKRLVLGSTAERVVRFAKCPVLIPRGKKFRLGALDCEHADFVVAKILVPLDFSQCSLVGLDYAAVLARHFSAKLCLFHAVFPYDRMIAPDSIGNVLTATDQLVDVANEQMILLKTRTSLRDLEIETRVAVGYPVDQIVSQTGNDEFNLIISTTHGRAGFTHALIGSVAEHIVRYAECPVLIVPATGA